MGPDSKRQSPIFGVSENYIIKIMLASMQASSLLTYYLASASVGLLICTLISENQGLEKSRSASNLRKISGPANLDFFLGLHLEKKLDLYHKPEKNPGDKLKKNPGLQDLKFF